MPTWMPAGERICPSLLGFFIANPKETTAKTENIIVVIRLREKIAYAIRAPKTRKKPTNQITCLSLGSNSRAVQLIAVVFVLSKAFEEAGFFMFGIFFIGGGGEIRTRGPLSRTPVFKTGALNRYATPPRRRGWSNFSRLLLTVEAAAVDMPLLSN